nr:unnamed protein product [Callosobruchus chinensis]
MLAAMILIMKNHNYFKYSAVHLPDNFPLDCTRMSSLCREHALVREFNKIMSNPQLQVPDIQRNRLQSRHPRLRTAHELHKHNFDINE